MRILGIDYGTKRIGVAITDESGTIAFPKEIVQNNTNALTRIVALINTEEVGEVVIGESLDLSGKENIVNKELKTFVENLKKVNVIKISFEKEFMTSVEARRTKIVKSDKDQTGASSRMKKEKGEKVDAHAAALILQRFIDRKQKAI